MTVSKLAALLVFVGLCVPAAAQVMRFDSIRRGTTETAILGGYGQIHDFPSTIKDRYSFDVLTLRRAWFTSPRTEVGVDLSYENANKDEEKFALSSALGYRRNFCVRGSTAIGYDLGIGLAYYYKKPESQGTKFNFTERIGLTLQHATGKHSAFLLGYEFSHTSNANIKLPNVGINASRISIGCAWYR